jgi:hypothetical protein
LKKRPVIISRFLKREMSVCCVFVSPCVFSWFPVKDMGVDFAIENNVGNALFNARLA